MLIDDSPRFQVRNTLRPGTVYFEFERAADAYIKMMAMVAIHQDLNFYVVDLRTPLYSDPQP